MIVCIAEKPSVARDIANVLGARNRKDGYIEGNGYCVTWTFGHLCTLKEPHEYNAAWKQWNLGSLPIIPQSFGISVINNPGIQKQFNVIESLLAQADEAINCGDAGQEGELIQRWVMHKAGCKCAVKRLWISSLTEEAIREGFAALKPQDDYNNLYFAGMSRAIGDWLLGMNATRLYTLKFGMNRQLLSIGRVQTPTLAMVVARQKEIDAFEPKPYWEIKTLARETLFSYADGRFETVESATEVMNHMGQHPLIISDIQLKSGIEAPPRLLDLTTLQVECNRKFGFTADQSLKLIQSLYEKKITTYPRVDTTYLSNDIYPKIPGILKGLTQYAELTAPLLGSAIKKSKKVFDDTKVTDHHAIIPTGQKPRGISVDEQKVFDMVARRFIAAFYPDCRFKHTTINAKVERYDFKATGKLITEQGWRVVIKDVADDKDDAQVLPEFIAGEQLLHEPRLEEKQTQPPKYYTEATLLRAMETAGKQVDDDELRDLMKENGIGRPSTRANIIETLFKRNYLIRDKKRIIATDTGIGLIDTIQNDMLKSAELTGLWEKNLRAIERGQYDRQQFLAEMKQMVTEMVTDVKNSNARAIPLAIQPTTAKPGAEAVQPEKEKKAKAEPKAAICPLCKTGEVLTGNTAYGCARWKEGCTFRLPMRFEGVDITPDRMKRLVAGKSVGRITFKGERLKGPGIVKLNAAGNIMAEPDMSKPSVCPVCGKGEIIEGNAAFGCSAWREGCKFRMAKTIDGITLTETLVKQLGLWRTTLPITQNDGSTITLAFDGHGSLIATKKPGSL